MASATARGLSHLPPALSSALPRARARALLLPACALPSPARPLGISLGGPAPRPPRRPCAPCAAAAALEADKADAPEIVEAQIASEDLEEGNVDVPEPVEAQVASVEAPRKEDVYAVVVIGSRQYIVFPGRFITTQRLKGANVNDKIVLNKVLLVGTRKYSYVGQPIVPNALVHAVVEDQGLDKKVIIFKYKKKKNYRRRLGHRQPNTRIKITAITGYDLNAPSFAND